MKKGLVTEGLGLRVGDRDLLRDVSITVDAGVISGLVGSNGAGKSTALKLIAGEILGGGRVWLSGTELTAMNLAARARRGLGYLPQGAASLPGLRAREQLAVFAELHGARGKALTARVDEALEAVGMRGRAEVRVESLSGGERRRVEVAGVLLGRFEVLVLDEPFAALDRGAIETVSAALRAQCARGAAVLFADHAQETLAVCDHATLLVDGEVRAAGDPRSVADGWARAKSVPRK